MIDEGATHTTSLLPAQDIGVSNEVDVAHVLDSHHADQFSVDFVAPEPDAIGDLVIELLDGHVRLMPVVMWDRFTIRLSSLIHDRENPIALIAAAKSNLRHPTKRRRPNRRVIAMIARRKMPSTRAAHSRGWKAFVCSKIRISLDKNLIDGVHDSADSRRYLTDRRVQQASEVTEKRTQRPRSARRHRGLWHVDGHGSSEGIESDRCEIDREDVALSLARAQYQSIGREVLCDHIGSKHAASQLQGARGVHSNDVAGEVLHYPKLSDDRLIDCDTPYVADQRQAETGDIVEHQASTADALGERGTTLQSG